MKPKIYKKYQNSLRAIPYQQWQHPASLRLRLNSMTTIKRYPKLILDSSQTSLKPLNTINSWRAVQSEAINRLKNNTKMVLTLTRKSKKTFLKKLLRK